MAMPEPLDGTWSTELCSCCAPPGGCGLCCFVCCCSCIQFGKNVQMAGKESFCGGKYGSFWGPTCCYALSTLPGWAISLFTGYPVGGMPCFCHAPFRTQLRERFGIEGDAATDWITTFLCPLCALCQDSREIKIRLKTRKVTAVRPAPVAEGAEGAEGQEEGGEGGEAAAAAAACKDGASDGDGASSCCKAATTPTCALGVPLAVPPMAYPPALVPGMEK